ncbi:MAG TPA: cupin domain-containing protein [Gaiellaceae bacterium]|nr:cupin domain-containing protein [Gaiellaceae bacterium]
MELDVSQPILLVPGEGEVVGDAPDRRVEILCDRDELVVTWTRFGPGRDGASAHVHQTHCDLFYVLAGELTFLVGPEREERVLPAGTLALAPPLLVHGFRNASDTELRYLNLHAPGARFADFLRGKHPGFDQLDPPADGGRAVTDAVVLPPGTRGVLVDRDEIRVEVREEPGPRSGRLTCLYALEGGGVLELRA